MVAIWPDGMEWPVPNTSAESLEDVSKKTNQVWRGMKGDTPVIAHWVNHKHKGKWLRIFMLKSNGKEEQVTQLKFPEEKEREALEFITTLAQEFASKAIDKAALEAKKADWITQNAKVCGTAAGGVNAKTKATAAKSTAKAKAKAASLKSKPAARAKDDADEARDQEEEEDEEQEEGDEEEEEEEADVDDEEEEANFAKKPAGAPQMKRPAASASRAGISSAGGAASRAQRKGDESPAASASATPMNSPDVDASAPVRRVYRPDPLPADF